MNTLQKSMRFGLVATMVVSLFVVATPKVFAEDGSGCDYCSGSYVESIDWTYPASNPSYVESIDYTYPGEYPSYVESIDYTYPADQWDPVDVYDVYDTYDTYDQYEYTIEEGVAYSDRSYSTPSYSTPSYSQPFSFRAPSTSYAPSYPAPQPQPRPQPVYYPVQQQQQQQQQQGGGQPINIVNTNNNVNTNTNVNTAPVTPVYQAPVTYPVQYVYPQQPVYPTQNAYCVITASPSSITNGQAAYLTWSSSGATSAWLSDGIGQVAVNGSLAVRPNSSKMYTLTVSGYGGTNTCTAYVTVQGSYISLTQIPYTGFDAGLLGNALYWLSLISFAVAGAYLTVYYLPRNIFGGAGKVSALAFAGSSLRARKQNAVAFETVKVPEESKVEAVETPVETMTPSPIDVMEFLPVASVARSTKDAMQVLPSNDGGAPRIVITRS